MKKVKKRNEMKTWKNKCDTVFSKVIRKIGYCQWPQCNKTENLQCSHIHSREFVSVRWDLKNAFCFCAGHHLYYWHKHPIMAAEVAKTLLGEYEYSELNYRAQKLKCNLTVDDLKIKCEELERLYHESSDMHM